MSMAAKIVSVIAMLLLVPVGVLLVQILAALPLRRTLRASTARRPQATRSSDPPHQLHWPEAVKHLAKNGFWPLGGRPGHLPQAVRQVESDVHGGAQEPLRHALAQPQQDFGGRHGWH